MTQGRTHDSEERRALFKTLTAYLELHDMMDTKISVHPTTLDVTLTMPLRDVGRLRQVLRGEL